MTKSKVKESSGSGLRIQVTGVSNISPTTGSKHTVQNHSARGPSYLKNQGIPGESTYKSNNTSMRNSSLNQQRMISDYQKRMVESTSGFN